MGAFRPVRIFFKQFRKGLAENGYFEDKNVTLDWRCAEGRFDRLGIWPQAAAGHQEAAQRRPGPVATFQIDPREALAFQVRIEQSLSRGQLRRQNRDLIVVRPLHLVRVAEHPQHCIERQLATLYPGINLIPEH